MGENTASEFESVAGRQRRGNLVGDLWHLLRRTKKWWLLPVIVMLMLVGGVMLLSSTAAAPFIYTLF